MLNDNRKKQTHYVHLCNCLLKLRMQTIPTNNANSKVKGYTDEIQLFPRTKLRSLGAEESGKFLPPAVKQKFNRDSYFCAIFTSFFERLNSLGCDRNIDLLLINKI